ncbi:transcription factor TFIID complex subunit 8 C-term-domain-containing protein [Halenospora varia]|nr:transcription factor TFIID complex subunit 8 C-term-domain-containing protein [Halenospora varia]
MPALEITSEDMAPISPISRKRSTPSHSDDDISQEPVSKRRCIEPALPQTPPPEEAPGAQIGGVTLFNDDPKQLLLRSIAIALQHVGFDGGTAEAMEAFAAEVETYAEHFLSKLTTHMYNSRRAQPTPIDYEYVLSSFKLPISHLMPHLKPPVPTSKTRIHLEPEPPEEKNTFSVDALLGDELSGDRDRKTKAYIPGNFPAFPSKHTYKSTPKESARETDPRKIREEAAKAARQGEEALRRLVKVSKNGKEKSAKKAASKDPKTKNRYKLWERAMDELAAAKGEELSIVVGEPQENDDRSMIVNADRQYYRKGALTKRKPPAEALIL